VVIVRAGVEWRGVGTLAVALARSSTLLAHGKNVSGTELRICIVFRLEGPGPIIGSLQTVNLTLFYMQGMGGVP